VSKKIINYFKHEKLQKKFFLQIFDITWKNQYFIQNFSACSTSKEKIPCPIHHTVFLTFFCNIHLFRKFLEATEKFNKIGRKYEFSKNKLVLIFKNVIYLSKNIVQKSGQIWSKMKILIKSENFDQKWKFWSKREILVKNWNFGQKWKFWAKMEIFVKNRNLSHFKFLSQLGCQNTKFRSKFETRHFGQKFS